MSKQYGDRGIASFLINFIKNYPRSNVSKQVNSQTETDLQLYTKLQKRNQFVLNTLKKRQRQLEKEELVDRKTFIWENSQKKKDLNKAQQKRIQKREQAARKKALRTAKIVDWYVQGLTYDKIGKKFGISRERVRQILLIAKEEGLEFETRKYTRREGVDEIRICPCGKSFKVFVHKGEENKRRACSRVCREKYRIGYKYKTPEEAISAQNARARARYHNSPEHKKRIKQAQRKYLLKIRHTPAFRKKQKIYSRRWREKAAKDPVQKEKARIRAQKNYQKQKLELQQYKITDPLKYKKLRAAQKIRANKYLDKLAQDPVKYEEHKKKVRERARARYLRLKADRKKEEGSN